MTAMVTVCAVLFLGLLCCCCSSVCVTATGDDNNDNSSPPSPELGKPDPTRNIPGALQPYGGETGVPQTESGRDSEEGLRSQGPSFQRKQAQPSLDRHQFRQNHYVRLAIIQNQQVWQLSLRTHTRCDRYVRCTK
ncbi:mucin TcMUCII [Trypanosoma cruzi]|nr:mucin TcMUCII [Trypanosoma cruzi]